jgi:hypothetical protein
VKFASVEDCFCIAEDVVYIPLDEAIVEELPVCSARSTQFASAGMAVGIKGILATQNTHTVQHGTI